MLKTGTVPVLPTGPNGDCELFLFESYLHKVELENTVLKSYNLHILTQSCVRIDSNRQRQNKSRSRSRRRRGRGTAEVTGRNGNVDNQPQATAASWLNALPSSFLFLSSIHVPLFPVPNLHAAHYYLCILRRASLAYYEPWSQTKRGKRNEGKGREIGKFSTHPSLVGLHLDTQPPMALFGSHYTGYLLHMKIRRREREGKGEG